MIMNRCGDAGGARRVRRVWAVLRAVFRVARCRAGSPTPLLPRHPPPPLSATRWCALSVSTAPCPSTPPPGCLNETARRCAASWPRCAQHCGTPLRDEGGGRAQGKGAGGGAPTVPPPLPRGCRRARAPSTLPRLAHPSCFPVPAPWGLRVCRGLAGGRVSVRQAPDAPRLWRVGAPRRPPRAPFWPTGARVGCECPAPEGLRRAASQLNQCPSNRQVEFLDVIEYSPPALAAPPYRLRVRSELPWLGNKVWWVVEWVGGWVGAAAATQPPATL